MYLLAYATIILTAIYLVVVLFDLDKSLGYLFYPIDAYSRDYGTKPRASSARTVIAMRQDKPDAKTIKSLLDQSVRVDDIQVFTDNPGAFVPFTSVLSVHPSVSFGVGENDESTIIVTAENGTIYPYDYVENVVSSYEAGVDVLQDARPTPETMDESYITRVNLAFKKMYNL